MHSLVLRVFSILYLIGGLAHAVAYALDDVNDTDGPKIKATRSTNTCADPSLAHTVVQAFNAPTTVHQLNFVAIFEDINSRNAQVAFANELPAFIAWPTQQEFISPLFQLGRTSPPEVIYALGADAQTPPVISGFINPEIVAWAYSTQVCGSVPLMSARLASATDNYYTIDPFVHSTLIASGWSDTGVIAFVLPLYSS